MIMTGANDLYGVGELEAACSALIATDEREHDLTDWFHPRADAHRQP
jgi:hypothetical protein